MKPLFFRSTLLEGTMPQPQLQLVAVDRPEVRPLPISPRLKSQVVYFMTPARSPGVPPLGENEYWIAQGDVAKWQSDGVLLLVSPLDSENFTEVELSDEQEAMLEWLARNQVQHVRVVE
jgi:hypothetical protein